MSEVDVVGRSGAWLSAVEIGLGSFLHAMHVPLTGYFLSLNQVYLLSRTTYAHANKPYARRIGLSVSGIAALLKSLSPAGKKLTPMLAISMQGFLFSVGIFLFGTSRIGIVAGCMLSSVWAFVQAPMIALLVFGRDLVDALKMLEKQIPIWLSLSNILFAIGILVVIKAMIAAGLGLLATRRAFSKPSQFEQKLYAIGFERVKQRAALPVLKPGLANAAKGALRDMFNVWFLLSLVLTILFFVWVEAPFVKVFWGLLRPIAFAFLLFLVVRLLPIEKILNRMRDTRFRNFANAIGIAVNTLKRVE